jgi:hypothetical protein
MISDYAITTLIRVSKIQAINRQNILKTRDLTCDIRYFDLEGFRQFAVECILSRRDSPIVARHEVPGIMRKIAPSRRDG